MKRKQPNVEHQLKNVTMSPPAPKSPRQIGDSINFQAGDIFMPIDSITLCELGLPPAPKSLLCIRNLAIRSFVRRIVKLDDRNDR